MLLESGIEEAQSSRRLVSADDARVYWLGQQVAIPVTQRHATQG